VESVRFGFRNVSIGIAPVAIPLQAVSQENNRSGRFVCRTPVFLSTQTWR